MLKVEGSILLVGGFLGIWGKCRFFSSGALSLPGTQFTMLDACHPRRGKVRFQAYRYNPIRVKILTPPYLTNPRQLFWTKSTWENLTEHILESFVMLCTAAEHYNWRDEGWEWGRYSKCLIIALFHLILTTILWGQAAFFFSFLF